MQSFLSLRESHLYFFLKMIVLKISPKMVDGAFDFTTLPYQVYMKTSKKKKDI